MTTTPYRTAAGALFAAGWWPLPLPPNAKTMPPTGFTGEDGRAPTADDVIAHALDPRYGNVAIRLPKEVIGLDVDAYGDKPGAATLATLEREHGALPATVMITSRTDGVSGIRLYRLPAGVDEADLAGGVPGIEVIRFGHRYAVAPPSIHPTTGQPYRWLDTATGSETGIPSLASLPVLPAAWLPALRKTASSPASTVSSTTEARTPTAHRGTCKVAPRWLSEALRALEQGASRHDVATRESLRGVRFEEMGHDIAREIDTFGLAFITAISKDRDGGARTATYEWQAMLDGARAAVAADPSDGEKTCCEEYPSLTPWEPLLAPPADPGEHSSWHPVALDAYLDGTAIVTLPSLLRRSDGANLLYAGKVHSIYGESESGKSWIVQHAAAQEINAEHGVIYIDFESEPHDITHRLLLLGAEKEKVRQHLTYIRPEAAPHPADPAWASLLAATASLVIIDGVTEALTMWGGASKENDDITTFMRHFPRAIARATKAAVVLVDHVAKDRETRGRFAIGGQAKLAAIDGAAYLAEPLDGIAPGKIGRLTLRVTKDRPGSIRKVSGMWRKSDRTQEAAVIVFDATAEGAISFMLAEPDLEAEVRENIRQKRVDAILEIVAAEKGIGINALGSKIRERVTIAQAEVTPLVKELIAANLIENIGRGNTYALIPVTAKPVESDEDDREEVADAS